MESKSNVAITMIRTGHGDNGDTKLGGKAYRKGHPLVGYGAALDIAQGFTIALPRKMFTDYPREYMQELLFRLGAVIGGRGPKAHELALQELGTAMERTIGTFSRQLTPLDSFLRCTPENAALQQLRASIREAEVRCVAARDAIEYEDKDTSPNLLHMLNKSGTALNIASDYVFAFTWFATTNERGNVNALGKWMPMSDEKLALLNDPRRFEDGHV
jgi:cob(I)alamin adenosyltransferase